MLPLKYLPRPERAISTIKLSVNSEPKRNIHFAVSTIEAESYRKWSVRKKISQNISYIVKGVRTLIYVTKYDSIHVTELSCVF